MKTLITLLALIICAETFAQNDINKYVWYRYKYGDRVARLQPDSVLGAPNDTTYSKDGLAIKGSQLYVGDGTRWRIPTPDLSTHIETTGYYSVEDSVNTIICQYAEGNTGIDLPAAASYDKREITISNVSGNEVSFNYLLKYSATEFSDVLANGKWVKIKSDGSWWNVVQVSGSSSSSTSSGGITTGTNF